MMKSISYLICVLAVALVSQNSYTYHVQAFAPDLVPSVKSLHRQQLLQSQSLQTYSARSHKSNPASSSHGLQMSSEKDEEASSVRSKLLTESIAPWRTLRLFLYVSLGSGAFLGGFITLTGVLAAASGAKPDVDFNTEYLNLGIDFGAVAAFAALFYYDSKKGAELNTKVEEKIKQKKENKVVRKAMKEREKALGDLSLNVRISEDTMQQVKISDIQTGAKQHIIIVAGTRKPIRDALLGANILKMEFAMRDVLVVPFDISKSGEDEKIKPDGSGFGKPTPTWETQPYVAQPLGDEWKSYINAEMDDAVKQNGESVKDDGIAIVVANTGEIIRRGVGQVPWRDMVEELEKKVKEEEAIDLSFLSGN